MNSTRLLMAAGLLLAWPWLLLAAVTVSEEDDHHE